ncbi:MAG: hypothetical protein F6K09_00520 [Merismopedia sp. SIO2A8]|nr:hypothetical protein [Symploca sp. SIO2B6]NET47248.1 hypothetical protein [Merismopedia sp. SIO2A8]
MKSSPLRTQVSPTDVSIYECEIHLKFKLIEDKGILTDREHLLEILLDALSCGTDEYLEMQTTYAGAKEIPETDASAEMRRQVIRLRNSKFTA